MNNILVINQMVKVSLPVDGEGYLIVEVQDFRFAIPISTLNGIETYQMMMSKSFSEYENNSWFKRVINLDHLLKLEKREIIITNHTRILNYIRKKGNELIRVRIDQIHGYINIKKKDIQKINEPLLPFITQSLNFHQQSIPIINLLDIINTGILQMEHTFE